MATILNLSSTVLRTFLITSHITVSCIYCLTGYEPNALNHFEIRSYPRALLSSRLPAPTTCAYDYYSSRAMPPKPPKTNTATVKMFQCPVLTGKSDFEPWWTLMDDLLYSANWQDIWSAGLTDPSSEEDIEADLDFDPNESRRQEAWGPSERSLPPSPRATSRAFCASCATPISRKTK